MPRFLHVGCGHATKEQTTAGFNSEDWDECRFDIDISVAPDIVGSMTDMSCIDDDSYDAVYSSHNIEHLYAHEVETALAEFYRILKTDGFLVITCPDIQSVAEMIAEGKLLETAYISPAGPICPIDMIYGYRPSLKEGKHYMAHKCGFTESVLNDALLRAGFQQIASKSRGKPKFDLHAVATKSESSPARITDLASAHFPFKVRYE
jgi:SAM-dependent methyltransferase